MSVGVDRGDRVAAVLDLALQMVRLQGVVGVPGALGMDVLLEAGGALLADAVPRVTAGPVDIFGEVSSIALLPGGDYFSGIQCSGVDAFGFWLNELAMF